MTKGCWIFVFLFLAVSHLSAQDRIVTHSDFTAQTLVKDIFASGACDNIDLITPIGNADGIGYFENGSASIGLDKGIILATGPVGHAAGPNESTDKSGDLSGPNGDGDLNRLTPGSAFDAVGIAFDFVPLDSFVTFRYVFASEEYCEFVGSNYNDVFGFFVSGPGIDGEFTAQAENVARIPGTSDFVAINSVNADQNSQYYIHNERPDDQGHCYSGSVETPHLDQIEYDGFTQVLTATLKVVPCESYHIRLVVGDISDPFFDSAVFLEAGSFNLGGEVAVASVGDTAGPGQLFEGCEDAAFRFSRSADSPLEHPLTVHYYLSSASTATSGEDYEPLPAQVTIAAGDTYADVPVQSLPDALTEEEELLRVVLDIPCACYADSADLYIVPPPLLELSVEDIYVCPGANGTLLAEASGGVGPYSYVWSGGSQSESQQATLMEPLQTLTLTDFCGQEQSTTAEILASTPPTALLSGIDTICQGDTAWLMLDMVAVAPIEIGYSLNGGMINYLTLTEETAFPATQNGQYQLLSIQDAACAGMASGEANLRVWEIATTAELDDISCTGAADGNITLEVTAGLPPFEVQWSTGAMNESSLQQLSAGSYAATITDSRSCEVVWQAELLEPLALQAPSVDCEALFADEIVATASGGTPPYRYSVSVPNWLSSNNWLNNLTPGESYELTIQDVNGCELETPWLMPLTYPLGMAQVPDNLEMPLGALSELTIDYQVPAHLLDQVNWTNSTQLSCWDCPYPQLNAIVAEDLSFTVIDVFGCQQSFDLTLSVVDRVDAFIPNAFSPNGDDNNDLWNIYGNALQIERIEQVLIFDRWGNHLFQANDWPINSDRHGWDGTWRGREMDAGVYAYSVTFRLVNGEIRTLGGDVLLMR